MWMEHTLAYMLSYSIGLLILLGLVVKLPKLNKKQKPVSMTRNTTVLIDV